MNTPVVSIIGRPNVGKSTLFNRILKNFNKAIMYNEPGVTRDRHYEILTIDDDYKLAPVEVVLVDTGGFYPELKKNPAVRSDAREDIWDGFNNFIAEVTESIQVAIDESDLILLVVSAKEGLQPFDEAIYRMLKKSQKPFWLVVNKSDGPKDEIMANEFLRLKMPEDSFYCVSGAHGAGVVDMKERIQKFLNDKSEFLNKLSVKSIMPKAEVAGNITIIGLPNAGKSSLLNRLLKENRAVVSNIPGTTVDPIEGYMDLYFGEEHKRNEAEPDSNHWKTVKIIDTAGIRKRANIKHELESQSVFHALRSISSSDVVLYCVDANKGISHQDLRLCEIVLDKGKSLMIILNKIDLRPKELYEMGQFKEWLETIKERSVWLNYCEFLPISVKTGEGLGKLKAKLVETLNVRLNKIPTGRLNSCLEKLTGDNPLILEHSGGKRLKVKYASIVSMTPPTVLMFCNGSLGIPVAYRKYLIKGIREEFQMKNTPIHLIFRNKVSSKQELTTSDAEAQEGSELSL